MKLLKLPKGLFFWRNSEKKEAQKAEEMLQLYVKYIPQIRKIMREEDTDERSDGEIIGQMYDYYKDAEETTRNVVDEWGGEMSLSVNSSGKIINTDKRKSMTPVEAMKELEQVPTPFDVNLKDLDEKISTLKDKSKLLHQRYAKAQIDGLTKRLENRKKYKDEAKFYSSFPNTTDDKIDDLLAKYKLVMKTSDLFVPTFPKEAIDIMKRYTSITKKITNETPVYYVIAEVKDFEKKQKKLDPILLVQSPFGFYWQLLGAWGKEMLLLSEL